MKKNQQVYTYKSPYSSYQVNVITEHTYSNNRRAIEINEEFTGEPICVATVNLPDDYIAPNEVIIKNWSENYGVLEFLQQNGFIGPVKRKIQTGFCEAEVCDFLK